MSSKKKISCWVISNYFFSLRLKIIYFHYKKILKDGFLLEKYGSKQLEEFSKKGVVEVEEEFFIISGTFTLTLGLVSQKIADEFIEYIELTLS